MTSAPALNGMATAVDPALPGLAAALSAPPPGTALRDECRSGHIEWSPGRQCRIVHQVRAPGRTTFVAAEVTSAGTTVRDLTDDRGLPGIRVALSPLAVIDRLADVCPEPLRAVRITPVAYRPGTRAVVAYDLVTAAGGSTPSCWPVGRTGTRRRPPRSPGRRGSGTGPTCCPTWWPCGVTSAPLSSGRRPGAPSPQC